MTRDEWVKTLEKGKVWAELGVFLGDFSRKIFEHTGPKELHLVDIFPDFMMSGDKDGNNVIHANLTDVPYELTRHFNSDSVKIHKMTTEEFLLSIPDESIDVIYIDADHSYNSVMKDLTLSLTKIKSGGLLSGHDYHSGEFPGVFNAVNDFCAKFNLKIDLITSDDGLPSFVIHVKK
jgi:hypothetical protein